MQANAFSRVFAVLDVLGVRFVLLPLLYWGITEALPQLNTWQVQRLGLPFPVLNHTLMILVPLLIAAVRKKQPRAYGIAFKDLGYHLNIAGVCFIPVVLANIPFGMGLDYQRWPGALLLAGVRIALFFVLARLLRTQPSRYGLSGMSVGVLLMAGWGISAESPVTKALAVFVTYAVFVGFGEEILYRGYIQSRLNEAFGRPYTVFGVKIGWGMVIASLLFGLSHVGLVTWILGPSRPLTWAWGFWTFFGGFVYGLVREKSGSIVAPAILHGLPQAIASVAMLFL